MADADLAAQRPDASADAEVVVIGRVSYDLNPVQTDTRLEDVTHFERTVGGFGGNVATGLARLGVPTLLISGVGDDPHGRYVRAWLAGQGVDTSGLTTHPVLRTSLAFYEAWLPDRFVITLFRSPSAPDWELTLADVPVERFRRARIVVASGTGLARQPSLKTTMSILADRRDGRLMGSRSLTILDLDWRPMAWSRPELYGRRVSAAVAAVDVVVGGDAEFAAASMDPAAQLTRGPSLVIVKHGPDGATAMWAGGSATAPAIPVERANGIGAGDGFLAALTAALFEGREASEAVQRANVAGAIVASRDFCSTAMPYPSEIEALANTLRAGSGAVV